MKNICPDFDEVRIKCRNILLKIRQDRYFDGCVQYSNGRKTVP